MIEAVERAKQELESGKSRLLKTFSFVPDDKLNWSPSETSKSALRIVAHCGVSNHGLAGIIRGEKPSFGSPEELFTFIEAEEQKIASREAAITLIEGSTLVVHSALDGVSEAQVNTMVESPFGTFPMLFWMNLPGLHMQGHASQIDYLQTIWGDLEFHI